MRSRKRVALCALLLFGLTACTPTGSGVVLDVSGTPTPAARTSAIRTSSTDTRDQAIQQALQAAEASAPEVRLVEARLEQTNAELIDRAEAQKRGASGIDANVVQLWWVEIRGYYRYQGTPAPGVKPAIYEADRRVFVYDAASGRLVGALIPNPRVAGQTDSPTPVTHPAQTPEPPGPQGRIAFVRSGDIYLLDPSTGSETRLTADGRNHTPHWGTDARTLFFTSAAPATDANTQPMDPPASRMWRWTPDSGTQLIGLGLPSPDGASLAVEERVPGGDGATVVWIQRSGARWQVMPAEPGVRWQALAWSSDARRLALARLLPNAQRVIMKGAAVPLTGATLWLAETEAPNPAMRQLSMPPTDNNQPGVPDVAWWSPDDRYLTVGAGPALPCASCRADGLPFFAVSPDGTPPVELGSAVWMTGAPSWAPGSAFAVLSSPAGRETYHDKHLLRVDPVTGARRGLADDPRYADIEPAVSPDGHLIAFARGWSQLNGVPQGPVAANLHPNIATIASRHLWLVGSDGSGPHQLLDETGWTDEAPVWSADGSWVLFVRWRPPAGEQRNAAAELWAVKPDGSGARRLVPDLGNSDVGSGFGYYGAFRWRELFAIAPG